MTRDTTLISLITIFIFISIPITITITITSMRRISTSSTSFSWRSSTFFSMTPFRSTAMPTRGVISSTTTSSCSSSYTIPSTRNYKIRSMKRAGPPPNVTVPVTGWDGCVVGLPVNVSIGGVGLLTPLTELATWTAGVRPTISVSLKGSSTIWEDLSALCSVVSSSSKNNLLSGRNLIFRF